MADNKVNFLRGTSAEYKAKTKDNDTFYYTTDTKKLYLGETEITSGGVIIDNALSDISEHPVQNKVVNAALNTKANASDLSEHTGNAEIHVTAEEKAAWDGKAEISDIPSKLPADGGNADTVDNKHASDFSQIINLGNASTDTKTAIGIQYKTTTYWCSAWTDYPAGLLDGQGVIIAVNYKGSGTTGTDNLWCRQFFFSPSGSATRIFQRIISGISVGAWNDIADGGAAKSAEKLSTARNINGMSFDGSANRVNYGTCSTEAATATKVVSCAGFALVTGAEITVKFTVTNTASSPTLNVNSTGAKAVYYRGAAISAGYLAANRTYTFRYNGAQYELVGDIDTNSTYGAASTSAAGLVSTGAQTFAGLKTFNNGIRSNVGVPIYISGSLKYLNAVKSNSGSADKDGLIILGDSVAELQVKGTNIWRQATSISNRPELRNLASGTSAATTTNCPKGSWYGKHS